MRFGLKEEVIEAIHKVLARHPEVEKAILYGSRAKGNYKLASDIDLTLMGENIDTTLLYKISWELDDLLLPYTFDLSLFYQINNIALLDHINRVGIIFFSKE